MKDFKKKEIIDLAKQLEESIQAVITDLSQFKGAAKERELYCYWRDMLWEIERYLREVK